VARLQLLALPGLLPRKLRERIRFIQMVNSGSLEFFRVSTVSHLRPQQASATNTVVTDARVCVCVCIWLPACCWIALTLGVV